MSDLAIEEKIRKIREDLYNFNLGEQSSLERYLEENQELQFSELESGYKCDEKIRLKSSQSAENLNNFEEFDNSPKFFRYNPESTANYQEFTLNKEKFAMGPEKNNPKDLENYNKALLTGFSESKTNFIKKIAEKDEIIQGLEQKLQKAELDLKFYTQGKANIDDLKNSTRELIYKADELDIERKTLIKENSQLNQKLLNIEKELNIIASESYEAKVLNQRLTHENKIFKKKLEEISKENEILYKTIKSHKNYNKDRQSLGSFSPKRHKSSLISHKFSLKESTKRFPYSEDEKTERKTRSPCLNPKTNKIPRPQSKENKFDHMSTCKILKEIMNLYSVNSPNLAISMIKSGIQDTKVLAGFKEFTEKIQKVIVRNSPPNTFKGLPGLRTSAKWVKRLVKEYLNTKKKIEDDTQALEILKNALNSESNQDVPRAVSKLLVENERLLRILSKLKKNYRLGHNVSIDEVEREIELRGYNN